MRLGCKVGEIKMADEDKESDDDEEDEESKPSMSVKVGTVGIGLGTLLLGTCMAKYCVVGGLEERLDNVNSSLQAQTTYQPRLKHENSIGGPEPDEFYDVDGKRAYVSIDGKPVSDYVLSK